MMCRRALVLALAAWPAPGRLARLQPGLAAPLFFDPEGAVLRSGGAIGAIVVPPLRARVLTLLPVAAQEVAVLGFARDSAAGVLEMAAVAGFDGQALRILALEVLTWRGADGAGLATRLTALPDRAGLRLQRAAAVPVGARRWREEWTDYLAWRPEGPFADAPVRVPVAETLQARLAVHRRAAIAWLGTPRQGVGPAELPEDPLRPPDGG